MKITKANQFNTNYISKHIPYRKTNNFMSKERKESTILLGWIAGLLFLFASFNSFVLRPIIKNEINTIVSPINTKLVEIQGSVSKLDIKVSEHTKTHGEQPTDK